MTLKKEYQNKPYLNITTSENGTLYTSVSYAIQKPNHPEIVKIEIINRTNPSIDQIHQDIKMYECLKLNLILGYWNIVERF